MITCASEKERALEAENNKLKQALRLQSELLANMSHELLTPLCAITGFSGLLYDGLFGQLTESQASCTNDIVESANKLKILLRNYLELAMLETGRDALELSPAHLNDVIRSCRYMLGERTNRRFLTIEDDFNQIKELVLIDAPKMKQALYHILAFAIDHTEEKSTIALHASIDASHLTISVSYRAPEFSDTQILRMFSSSPSVTLPAELQKAGEVITLSLALRIIEWHSGSISAWPAANQHCTMTLTVPLADNGKVNN